MKDIDELWNRVGLIAKLAWEQQSRTAQFGKTAVMKLLFILQEVYRVPLDYRFSLYTYGPYCSDVLSDLDYSEAVEAVNIASVVSYPGGYCVDPSQKTEHYIGKAKAFLQEHENSIEEVLKIFGAMTAKDLELRSTIIYIYKNYLKNKWEIQNTDIADDVKELKPYFTHEQILEAYQELMEAMIFDKLAS
jgi:hypothetical protein